MDLDKEIKAAWRAFENLANPGMMSAYETFAWAYTCGFEDGHAESEKEKHDELERAYDQGKEDGLREGYEDGLAEGRGI